MGQSKNWLIILFLTAVVVVGGIVLWPTAGPESRIKYCRVLFGPNAETEVLLGVSSDRLLVYRDAKSHDSPEQYKLKNSQIVFAGVGDTVYTITGASLYTDENSPERESVMLNVDISGESQFKQYCDVALSESKEALKYAHFDGPLTIGPATINWEISESFRLVAGDKPSDLRVAIGTLDKQAGCWVVVRTHEGEEPVFPDGVHPALEVEYVSKTSGEPIQEQYFLDQFC